MQIRNAVSICLLLAFALEPLAGFAFIYQQNHTHAESPDDVQCSCTCCGDVCPMGKDCCCNATKKILAGVRLVHNECQPQAEIPELFTFLSQTIQIVPQPSSAWQPAQYWNSYRPPIIMGADQIVLEFPSPPPR